MQAGIKAKGKDRGMEGRETGIVRGRALWKTRVYYVSLRWKTGSTDRPPYFSRWGGETIEIFFFH